MDSTELKLMPEITLQLKMPITGLRSVTTDINKLNYALGCLRGLDSKMAGIIKSLCTSSLRYIFEVEYGYNAPFMGTIAYIVNNPEVLKRESDEFEQNFPQGHYIGHFIQAIEQIREFKQSDEEFDYFEDVIGLIRHIHRTHPSNYLKQMETIKFFYDKWKELVNNDYLNITLMDMPF